MVPLDMFWFLFLSSMILFCSLHSEEAIAVRVTRLGAGAELYSLWVVKETSDVSKATFFFPHIPVFRFELQP